VNNENYDEYKKDKIITEAEKCENYDDYEENIICTEAEKYNENIAGDGYIINLRSAEFEDERVDMEKQSVVECCVKSRDSVLKVCAVCLADDEICCVCVINSGGKLNRKKKTKDFDDVDAKFDPGGDLDVLKALEEDDFVPILTMKGKKDNLRHVALKCDYANNGILNLLVDCGCSRTSLVNQNSISSSVKIFENQKRALEGFNGSSMSLGSVYLHLKFGKKILPVEFAVVEASQWPFGASIDALLGLNVLQFTVIDFTQNRLYFLDEEPRKRTLKEQLVDTEVSESLMALIKGSENFFKKQTPMHINDFSMEKEYLQRKQEEHFEQVPRNFFPSEQIDIEALDNHIKKKIVEVEECVKEIVMNKKKIVPVLAIMDKTRMEKVIDTMKVSHLADDVQRKLLEVIKKREKVFFLKGDTLPVTDLMQLKLHLDTEEPIFSKQYPLGPTKMLAIDKQLDEWNRLGIIQKGRGIYNSALTCAKKKNGEFRVCLDFRKLNNHLLDCNYGLPLVPRLVSSLSNSKYMICLDMPSAFLSISVAPESRHILGFSHRNTFYEFTRMAFGLKVSSFCFQAMMDCLLMGLLGKREFVDEDGTTTHTTIVNFIDDILICSDTVQGALRGLEDVLERFEKHHLKINPQKSEWLVNEVLFLGFNIKNGIVLPNKKKVDGILEMRAPKNVHEVKSFLASVGFFRHLLPSNVSEIELPLFGLLKKDVKFEWSQKCQESFEKIKQILQECKGIHCIDELDKSVRIIMSDSSQKGIGGCLCTIKDKKIVPIAFYSKALKASETKYSAYMREFLGLISVLEHFRYYVLGYKVVILTDNLALSKLLSTKFEFVSDQLLRWYQKLSMYDYKIYFIQGELNPIADILSRLCVNVVTTRLAAKKVKEAETVDEAQKVAQKEVCKNKGETFKTRDDDLVTKISCKENEGVERIEDAHKRKELIKTVHNLGHLGVTATVEILQKNYCWPGLRKMVGEFIKKCHVCQLNKSSRNPDVPLKLVTDAEEPGETFYLDLTGPLVESEGKKYILVVIDSFSRFVMVTGIADKCAETVVKALMDEIFLKFGIPGYLNNDCGSEFRNALCKAFLRYSGVEQRFSSPYRPNANLCERVNSSIKSILRCLIQAHKKSWMDLLQLAAYIYNTSPSRTLGSYTHAELFFGRPLKTFLEAPTRQKTIGDYLEQIKSNYNHAKQIVRSEKDKMRLSTKERHDKKAKYKEVLVGMKVYLKNHTRKGLEGFWEGPYNVIRVISPETIVIMRRNKERRVHLDNLKIAHDEDEASSDGESTEDEDSD
jgi:hypothetical protein